MAGVKDDHLVLRSDAGDHRFGSWLDPIGEAQAGRGAEGQTHGDPEEELHPDTFTAGLPA